MSISLLFPQIRLASPRIPHNLPWNWISPETAVSFRSHTLYSNAFKSVSYTCRFHPFLLLCTPWNRASILTTILKFCPQSSDILIIVSYNEFSNCHPLNPTLRHMTILGICTSGKSAYVDYHVFLKILFSLYGGLLCYGPPTTFRCPPTLTSAT